MAIKVLIQERHQFRVPNLPLEHGDMHLILGRREHREKCDFIFQIWNEKYVKVLKARNFDIEIRYKLREILDNYKYSIELSNFLNERIVYDQIEFVRNQIGPFITLLFRQPVEFVEA